MHGHRTTRTAALLCAALGLTAAVGTASAAPAASPPADRPVARRSAPPVLVDCFQHPQVRPDDFVLACGDGNSRLVSLKWVRWDDRSAKARGVNVVNDCKPYCAAGTFRSYPVVVRLDRAQSWEKDPATERYGRITLEYPAQRPEQFAKVMTYPLWD